MRSFWRSTLAALAVTAALSASALIPAQSDSQPQSVALERVGTSAKAVQPGAKLNGPKATSTLAKLKVKGKAPKTGYNRAKYFGAAWSYDYNRNKCGTRDDILFRDMSSVRKNGRCTVRSGTLRDPYDGKLDKWKVGKNTVDIDHSVALGNAWISGAQYWTGTRGKTLRKAIANDPLNLVAADAKLNRSKGDRNAAEWLPKNKSFRCQYVATQISVKYKYRLAVTQPEKNAMKRVLSRCKNQKAAKVSPVSVKTGKSVATSAKKMSKKKSTTAKKSTSAKKSTTARTVSGKVHPGAFCSQHGYKGKAKSGKTYTCKKSKTESRYRWRR